MFEPIGELNDTGNTFVVIQPDQDDPAWCASVTVLDEGGYEVVRRDATRRDGTRREHHVTTGNRVDRIALDPTTWLAARTF